MFLGYPRLSPVGKVGCCCGDVAQVQTNQDQVRSRFVRLVTVGNGVEFRGACNGIFLTS